MSKSPAYQTYPKDLMSDLRCMALPNNQYGMYRKLLDICWLEDGLPEDPAILAKGVGEPVTAFTRKHWPALRPFFFVREDGRLSQKRLEEEREKQRRWAEKSAEGGRRSAATRAQATGNHQTTTGEPPSAPNPNIAFPSPSSSPDSSPAPSLRSGATRPRGRLKRVIADDWTPGEAEIAYATTRGMTPAEIQAEAEEFLDHYIAAQTPWADWLRVWQRWVRRYVRERQAKANGTTGPAAEREAIGRRVCDRFGMGWQPSYARVDREVWTDLLTRYKHEASPPTAEIRAVLERNLGSAR